MLPPPRVRHITLLLIFWSTFLAWAAAAVTISDQNVETLRSAILDTGNDGIIYVSGGTWAGVCGFTLGGPARTVKLLGVGAPVLACSGGRDAFILVNENAGDVISGFAVRGNDTTTAITATGPFIGSVTITNVTFQGSWGGILACSNCTIALSGVTINNATSSVGAAAIGIDDGSLTLSSVLLANWTGLSAAGIVARGDASVNVVNSTFFALSAGGTAPLSFTQQTTATISNSTFRASSGGRAGGIYMSDTARLVVVGSTFRSLQPLLSDAADAINVFCALPGATVSVVGCSFTQNRLAVSFGVVVVQASQSVSLLVSNSSFTQNNNTCVAVLSTVSSLVLVSNSSFTTNTAVQGGGVHVARGSACDVRITASNFIDQSSRNVGGGIYVSGAHLVTILGSLFQGNNATNGGGIYATGGATLSVTSSTFVANAARALPGGAAMFLYFTAAVTISDCTIRNQLGIEPSILSASVDTVTISSCRFNESSFSPLKTNGSSTVLVIGSTFVTMSNPIETLLSSDLLTIQTSVFSGAGAPSGVSLIRATLGTIMLRDVTIENITKTAAQIVDIVPLSVGDNARIVASGLTMRNVRTMDAAGNAVAFRGVNVGRYATFNCTACVFGQINATSPSSHRSSVITHDTGALVALTDCLFTDSIFTSLDGYNTVIFQQMAATTSGAYFQNVSFINCQASKAMIAAYAGPTVVMGGSHINNTIFNPNDDNACVWSCGAALTVTGVTFRSSTNARGVFGAPTAFGGSMVVRDSVFVGQTTIGSGGAVAFYVYSSLPITSRVTLSNLLISDNTAGAAGGGIYCATKGVTQVILLVSNVTALRNIAQGGSGTGGGGLAIGLTVNVTVVNSTFRANTALANGGGLFWLGGGVPTTVVGNFSSLFFSGNAALSGGAVYLSAFVTANFIRTTISKNVASLDGGGAYAATRGQLVFVSSTVADNTCQQNGGGVRFSDTGFIANSTVAGNVATKQGGGIWADADCPLVVRSTLINGNSAQATGGGIMTGIAGELTLENCTLIGNVASSDGGAIYAHFQLASTSIITNSRFHCNRSGRGGGAVFFGAITSVSGLLVQRSIFSDNSATDGGAIQSLRDLLTETCTFEANFANVTGGAISMKSSASLYVNEGVLRRNRVARVVGFIDSESVSYCDHYSTVNTPVAGFGGAISMTTGALTVAIHSIFVGNDAMCGGVFSCTNGAALPKFDPDSFLQNNTGETSSVGVGHCYACGCYAYPTAHVTTSFESAPLLLGDWPNSYSCESGYFASERNFTETAVSNPNTVLCKPFVCPDIFTQPENGVLECHFLPEYDGQFVKGSYMKFRCDQNQYIPVSACNGSVFDDKMWMCNGTDWSCSETPRCAPLNCTNQQFVASIPSLLQSGYPLGCKASTGYVQPTLLVYPDPSPYGSTGTVYCPAGHEYPNSPLVTCELSTDGFENVEWNAPDYCIPMAICPPIPKTQVDQPCFAPAATMRRLLQAGPGSTCVEPTRIANYTVGSVAKRRADCCAENEVVEDAPGRVLNVTCGPNGWEGLESFARCLPRPCPPLIGNDHVIAPNGTSVLPGQTASLSCVAGYTNVPAQTSTWLCTPSLTWTPVGLSKNITCAATTCAAANDDTHVSDCTTLQAFGSSCRVTCRAGYFGPHSEIAFRCSQSAGGAVGTYDPPLPLCLRCPVGSYSGADQQQCTPCPHSGSTIGENSTQLAECLCARGYYEATFGAGDCIPCPEGGACDGNRERPHSAPHYAPVGGAFVLCTPPEACAGNGTCTPGYEGIMCGDCSIGYYRLGTRCLSCLGDSGGRIAPAVILALIAVTALPWIVNPTEISERTHGFTSVGIAISFFQVVSLFGDINLQWYPGLSSLFTSFSVTNLNIELLAPECLSAFGVYPQFQLLVLLPLLVGGYLGSVWMVASLIRSRMSGSDGLKKHLHEMGLRCLAGFLYFLSFAYIALSRAALSLFACQDRPDGNAYLVRYPGQLCDGGAYSGNTALGGIAIFVYVIGIPAGLLALFILRARRLGAHHTASHVLTGFYVWRYKARRGFWHSLTFVRMGLILIAVTFFRHDPFLQVSVVAVVCFFNCLFILVGKPHRFTINDRLESVSLVVSLFVILAGQLSSSLSLSEASREAASVLALTSIIIIMVTLVVAFGLEAYIHLTVRRLYQTIPWARPLKADLPATAMFIVADSTFPSLVGVDKNGVPFSHQHYATNIWKESSIVIPIPPNTTHLVRSTHGFIAASADGMLHDLPRQTKDAQFATPLVIKVADHVTALAVCGNRVVVGDAEGGAAVWSVDQKGIVRHSSISMGKTAVAAVTLSAKFGHAASEHRVVRFHVETSVIVREWTLAGVPITALADMTGVLVAGHADGTLSFIFATDDRPIAHHRHIDAVLHLLPYADETRLASVSRDGAAVVWSSEGHYEQSVNLGAASPISSALLVSFPNADAAYVLWCCDGQAGGHDIHNSWAVRDFGPSLPSSLCGALLGRCRRSTPSRSIRRGTVEMGTLGDDSATASSTNIYRELRLVSRDLGLSAAIDWARLPPGAAREAGRALAMGLVGEARDLTTAPAEERASLLGAESDTMHPSPSTDQLLLHENNQNSL